MMRSLYSGVAGLKTHQIKMDVIGNNIANVNTTAYKSQSITFNELMYQTTKKASGASTTTAVGGTNANQIGLGVKVGAINTNIAAQGATQTTNFAFDVAITGESFFVVNNGVDNLFTRAGSFTIDGMGNLVMTSTGYNVMGWQTDPLTGEIKPDTVSPLQIMNDDNMTFDAEATSLATASGIIDKTDPAVNSTTGVRMNLDFYDNNGYKYTAKLSVHASNGETGDYYVVMDDLVDTNGVSVTPKDYTFGATQPVSSSTSYGLQTGVVLTAPSATSINLAYPQVGDGDPANGGVAAGNLTIAVTEPTGDPKFPLNVTYDGTTFNPTGFTADNLRAIYGIDAATLANIKAFRVDEKGQLTVTSKTVNNAVLLKYSAVNGTFESTNAGTNGEVSLDGLVNLTFNPATMPGFGNVELNFKPTKTGNVNKTSSIGITAGGTGETAGMGTGRKIGEMSSITVQDDGKIYASYDNGQRRLLGQIATASFANPAGLEKQGDNLYAASMNSGDFDGIGQDIKEGGGYMTSGVLEMSNVDLSAEFTEMITTQRGFQANSRIITVSDTLLEELTNLKR